MDKPTLQQILQSAYDLKEWQRVLREVFGATTVLQTPDESLTARLTEADKKLASKAAELGSFETSDGMLVGVYQVDLTKQPRIWQNRVGLRQLLRSVYKHDVDAALVVFVQPDKKKWRLSLVSEISGFDDSGKRIELKTEPRRYTYLLGEGEKTATPLQRLSSINIEASLDDLKKAFSVEALNKEFYGRVAKLFYSLVGATTGKGDKAITHKRIMSLPGASQNTPANRTLYQEFAVRLIGRIVFCWFLKKKCSAAGLPLLPEELLSSAGVGKDYYHQVLEPLFFQTLNTPMEDRIDDLPDGCEIVPFLNGGLFEPQLSDFYNAESRTDIYYSFELKIPDSWFKEFFSMLEEYNFTLDENSTVDIEISVDPEMLGRIFENLLAEIDPDSGESARKATGSFYTPREIVDYMVSESLTLYLDTETRLGYDRLAELFRIDAAPKFEKKECEQILDALHRLKVLDPACGSGAFPMGVLHSIVLALEKLDKDASLWKEKQLSRLENPILKKQLEEKLKSTSVEYARKIGIIQNNLYGVDIQPIAAEIAKLRCFLTLVVDERVEDDYPNRGVEALPNLEFKFVTADSLVALPEQSKQGNLFHAAEQLATLQSIRNAYLQSSGEEKERLREQFAELQNQIWDEQTGNRGREQDARALALSQWKPFTHERSSWFDPEWMFGVSTFEIVIGNPPYISHDRIAEKAKLKASYETWEPFADVYCYFIEKAVKLLSTDGVLSFITSNSYLRAEYGRPLRGWILERATLSHLVNLHMSQVFESAIVNVALLFVQNRASGPIDLCRVVDAEYSASKDFSSFTKARAFMSPQEDFKGKSWNLARPEFAQLRRKIEGNHKTLEQLGTKIRLGIATGFNDAFIVSADERSDFIMRNKRNAAIIKPVLRGRDIDKYRYSEPEEFILLTKNGVDVPKEYPEIFEHLKSFGQKFKNRGARGQHWTNLRACAFFDDFKKPKIIWIEMDGRFAYCADEIYLLNSAYFLLPPSGIDPMYLLGILNSDTIRFYLKQMAETSGMGASRWINNYVKEFPIPEGNKAMESKINEKVSQVMRQKEQGKNTDRMEKEIDELVSDLYGLSPVERTLLLEQR